LFEGDIPLQFPVVSITVVRGS